MNVEGRWRRTIEPSDNGSVIVLDQARLPYSIEWMTLSTVGEVARAIRDMHIRGAPLIGATAAYGVAIASRTGVAVDLACAELAETRPTAINLRWALGEMQRALAAGVDPYVAAAKIADDDVAACEAIGAAGHAVIAGLNKDRVNVLTHCNAGWLATVDWGTALSPVYKAHEAGIAVHVWVEETRPRNQGMLTAWELLQHGVPHTVIADNAGGHLMQQGQVELCIVGTDRTTRNGDVCNKIGTYLKALAAHDNHVPFYVAVPSSSIDWTVGAPEEIPIEERNGDEVRFVHGRLDNGRPGRVEVVPQGSAVANPAFDVTPRRFVTGLITERGIATPAGLAELFGT
ncbi:MAG: S-methyl-5-thioribose-1-phosphate isomerase [Kofleriaceae bacterium]